LGKFDDFSICVGRPPWRRGILDFIGNGAYESKHLRAINLIALEGLEDFILID
jgi:hypothetical protein